MRAVLSRSVAVARIKKIRTAVCAWGGIERLVDLAYEAAFHAVGIRGGAKPDIDLFGL